MASSRSRFASFAFRLTVVLASVAVIVAVALAWRLSREPIALPFLVPEIETALHAVVPDAVATVGAVELAWVERRPRILVLDFALRDRDGSPILSLSRLSIRPSIRAALRGLRAIATIELIGAQARVIRTVDGRFTIEAGDAEPRPMSVSTGERLARLLASRREGSAASYLTRIDLLDARLKIEDRANDLTWRARDAEVSLRLLDSGVRARFAGELVADSAEPAPDSELVLPVVATLDASLGSGGQLTGVTFTASSDTTDDLGIVSALDIEGSYAREPAVIALEGELGSVAIDDVLRVWPPTAADTLHAWLTKNVHGGRVTGGSFHLRVPSGTKFRDLPDEAIDLRFDFEGVTVAFLDDFEPVTSAAGSATLTAARFTAEVASAASSGLTIEGARFAVGLRNRPAPATIVVDAQGEIVDMLSVLDRPPLSLPTKLGFAPRAGGGNARTHLELELPLMGGITEKDVRVSANAELSEASHPDLLGGVGVGDATLRASVSDTLVELAGDVDLRAGITAIDGPAKVEIAVERGADPTRQVRGTISGEKLTAIGTITLDPAGLRSVALSELRVAGSDLVVDLTRDGSAHYRLALSGRMLDLGPLFESVPDSEASSALTDLSWDLDLDVARVLTGRPVALENVTGRLRGRGRALTAFDAAGSMADGGSFTAELATGADGARLDVASDNGGRALEALGIDINVEGGKLTLSATTEGKELARPIEGVLELSDFRVVGAPLLAQVLALGSLVDLANVLRREGIQFSRARVPFAWTATGIELREARFIGGIGITADGIVETPSVVFDVGGQIFPAYTLNSALGRIPLIGKLLVGGEGKGVFGIDYRVRGPHDNANVTVNPLTTLSPGILRQMFVEPFTSRRSGESKSQGP